MRIDSPALHACLLACLLASPALSAADAEPAVLEEVRVQDEPGPLMWRVSRDDHVLWIIGTLTPVPKDLAWNTRQVKTAVQEAEEVLALNVHASVDGNAFTLMRHLPALLKLRKNPDGAQLRDLLAPEQYARWQRLYAAAHDDSPEDIEDWRPMILADVLYMRTLAKQGLVDRDPVTPVLRRIAKEAKVRTERRQISMGLGKPKPLIEEFRNLPRQRELDCLVATMDHIEQQLPGAAARAQAWATGDPALLTQDLSAAHHDSCTLLSVRESSLKEQIDRLEQQSRQAFLDMAGYALLGRGTSVTTMPVQFLRGERNVLDDLRASGYLIETPGGH